MDINFSNVPQHYGPRTHEKMKEVLMDPDGIGPAIYYYMIRGGKEQKNITVWEIGTVSGEYIKVYGHYHVGKLDEHYWITYGEGICLLQKPVLNKNGEIIPDMLEEFKAFVVKPGQHIYMPPYWGHLFANIGKTYFVTADNSPVNFDKKDEASLPGHADYESVKKTRGFAYYIVEHEGKPALLKNNKYKEIRKTDFGGIPVIEK